jgi:predicted PurR-regulated permease PerM
MTSAYRIRFWIAGLVIFGLTLVLFREILLPFVAGMAIAYLLDPLTDRLETAKLPRSLAATLVMAVFFAALLGLLLLFIPLLQAQLTGFIERLPDYEAALRERFLPLLELAQARLSPEDMERLRAAAGGLTANALSWFGIAIGSLWREGMAFVNLLGLIFITPVVAFYMLRDWDRIIDRIDGWLPRKQADIAREQFAGIDKMLSGFVRGQLSVCFLLGAFYGIGLSLVGLDFGLVVGLLTGLFSFVPIFGMLAGMLLAFILALAQFSEWTPFALIGAVFLAGQLIEGQFLTPKLVGERVGLHPVWVIFALLAGGVLFGALGLLLAVPVAATIGVLMRFALGQYLSGPLYRGADPGDET